MIFPLIQYPENYKRIIASTPRLPDTPVKPIRPAEPKSSVQDNGNLGCSVFVFIGALIFLFYSFSNTKLLLPAIALVLLSFFFIMMSSSDNKTSEEKLSKQKKEYPALLKRFNIETATYEQRMKDYEIDCMLMTSPAFIEDYKTNIFKTNFTVTKLPENAEREVKQGVSESYFLKYLLKHFNNHLLLNQMLKTTKGTFFPDFVVYDKNNNLFIDIEIDEPYVGSTGDPIHYDMSSDKKRNQIFSEQNWVVIRFSEEQIIKQPNECCLLIKDVLSHFPKLQVKEWNEGLVNPMNVWSYSEAGRMAFKKYRHSYLPNDLKAKLDTETFEESNIIFDEVIEDWRLRAPSAEYSDEDDLPF